MRETSGHFYFVIKQSCRLPHCSRSAPALPPGVALPPALPSCGPAVTGTRGGSRLVAGRRTSASGLTRSEGRPGFWYVESLRLAKSFPCACGKCIRYHDGAGQPRRACLNSATPLSSPHNDEPPRGSARTMNRVRRAHQQATADTTGASHEAVTAHGALAHWQCTELSAH